MRLTTRLTPCAAMVASALLVSACQSTAHSIADDGTSTPSVISESARALFDSSERSPAVLAKQSFTTALAQYLASERYAVSSYYSQAAPIYTDGSIDKDSDSVWTTVMKTHEALQHARSGGYQSNHYRSAVDYLYPREGDDTDGGETTLMGVDLGELPYLRYDDERPSGAPDTVTRAVGMGEDYQAYNTQIRDYSEELWRCAETTSERLDELVRANPNITLQDAKVKALQKRLDDCSSDVNDTAKSLLADAQGYQKSDITHLQSCLSDYRTGFGQIMSAARTPRALSGKAFDGYEALYGNFRMCTYVYYRSQPLEPYRYVDNYSQAGLELFTQTKACESAALAEQRQLQREGFDYTRHADKFLSSHYAQLDCVGQAIAEAYDDEAPATPTSMTVAKARMDTQTDQVNAYLYESHDSSSDYSGISGWYKAYKHTKTQGDKSHDAKSETDLGKFGRFGFLTMMLEHMEQTPEQAIAQNLYQYDRTSITSLSHHRPQARHIKTLWSLDYQSPTAIQSAQLPFIVDMNAGVLDADVSAALPILALISPKNAPLPDQIPAGQMRIAMPKDLSQKIPTAVIYDAIQRGIVAGYDDIAPQKFTATSLKDDRFAREVGAAQAIKIELNAKELGKLYATIAKYVVRDLKAYVDKNPTLYPDTPAEKDDKARGIKKGDNQADKVKKLIDEFAIINKGYRTSDVGGLLQIIEGIAPFGFDNVNYVYLNAKGHIIATQSITNIDDEMGGVRLQTVGQTRFGQRTFYAHPLSGQFMSSFSQPTRFDGLAWLKSIKDEHDHRRQARDVRLDYAYENDADESQSDERSTPAPTKASDSSHEDRDKTAEIFYQKKRQAK